MANITRIKAKDPKKSEKSVEKVEKAVEKTEKSAKIEEKVEKTSKKSKKTFILFRPFVALGRYIRDSWLEIRQVRWPSRKTTWKMLLAIFVYTALIVVVITLLDMLFTFLFNLIIA